MPAGCGVFRSAVPVGDKFEGHGVKVPAEEIEAPGSEGRVLRFRPADTLAGGAPALGFGFHYLVVACGDGKEVTPEIPLLVVSRQAAAILAPKSLETSASPTITWTPVPGVPAYHLLLSDQALEINTEKGTVGGASVIWQAITTRTSIAYGTPDPSGNFARQAAPPLSSGVTYNLVVLNNYDGKSTLATSSKAQALKLFSLQAPSTPLSKPKNLAPAPGSRLSVSSDTAITLRWSASRAGSAPANTYKPYIYSLEEEDGSEILVPIWSTEVTDTTATLDARRTLLSRRYVWKVFALGDAGAGVVGDTSSFVYRNEVQTLSLTVKGPSGPLSDVQIRITPLDGGASPIPVFTPSGGQVERTLAVGGYLLEFSKDGFAPETRPVTLTSEAPLTLEINLIPAAGRIRGRAVDAGGLSLDNVEVSAASGDAVVTARTDAQGGFLLGVGAGTHAVGFRKADHLSPADTLVAVKAGETVDIGRRTLLQAQGALSGSVANDKGVPMPDCQVTVRTAAGTVARTLRTDDRGAFSALLAPGDYTVLAARTGFTAEEKAVRLTDAAVLAFRLSPGASLVKGTVTSRAFPSASASVSTPLADAALELKAIFSGAVLRTASDLRGEFVISADTGTYLLRASAPGRTRPDSVLVRIDKPRSTFLQNL
ncbi:MAG TPA: carboxypeptidase-like regulatory domain-containing protein, partial [Fibrobacteria bacterium]|nr:carboxypeptidase-like regulatory domain-containing protein [Fibrobacteria bacterium]